MTLDTYINQFSKLRSDQSATRWGPLTKHRAPHKPLLLLAVLDQFAEGTIKSNLIEVSPDLGELFTLYWARVMPPDQRGSLALPFFHLQSDKFWHLLSRPGKETFLEAVRQIRSVNELRETVFGARLDEDLYALLRLQPSRDTLRRVLIETYFAPEAQAVLADQGVVNQEAYQYSKGLLKKAKDKLAKEGLLDDLAYRPAARDQGFRRAIIGAYNHTCVFCGLRVLTPDGHTAADAAHIVPWSQTHNDAIGNGMALCKLCHWGFDEGLLSASAKYRVVISPQLSAGYNIPAHLPLLKNKPMLLPIEQAFWPAAELLKAHRQGVYRER
jgi:putative restriction endonuclease